MILSMLFEGERRERRKMTRTHHVRRRKAKGWSCEILVYAVSEECSGRCKS